MAWRRLFWVGSFSTVFFCLPSLAIKLWETFVLIPWQYKSWLVYTLLAWVAVGLIRRRWRNQTLSGTAGIKPRENLLEIAKKRLVQGEIGLEEYRQIRDELKSE